jgi:hypothetical protein
MITSYKIYDPNSLMLYDAPSSNDLFCDFEIDLDGKSIPFKSVELKELISMLTKITETTTYYGTDEYSFELKGENEYKFKWNREDNSSTNHEIVIVSDKSELADEKIWTGHFHGWQESFYLRLMKELLETELFEFAKIYGGLFFKKHQGMDYKYGIADKVKTVLNENVKTERQGFIIGKWYHDNEKSNMYFLMIDGKRYKKRYFERDLELIN